MTKAEYMREYHHKKKSDPNYRAMRKRSRQKHKEKTNAYRATWAKADRDSHMEISRAREFAREMKKYSTTIEWYRDRLIEQNGLCVICGHLSHHHGTLQRLQVDHNHLCCDLHTKSCGKCLRGLLCADCNVLLSYLEKFMLDFPQDERLANHEVYLRNSVKKDSWTYRALQYLKKYADLKGRDSGARLR